MIANLLPRLRTAAIAILAIGVVGVGLFALARPPQDSSLSAAQQEDPPVPVQVATVEAGTIRSTLTYSGTIHAAREVNVAPRTSAPLASVLVEEGDTVGAGDPLATLDAGTLPSEVQQAAANLEAAQARLQVVLDGATTADFAAATQAVLSAENALNAAQTALETTQGRYTLASNVDEAQSAAQDMRGQRDSASEDLDAAIARVSDSNSTTASTLRRQIDNLDGELRAACGEPRNRDRCTSLAQDADDLRSLVTAIIEETSMSGANPLSILESFESTAPDEERESLESAAFRWLQAGTTLPGLNDRINDLVFAVSVGQGLPGTQELPDAVRARDAAASALIAAREQLETLQDGPASADELTSRAAVTQAEAQLASARSAVEQTTIYAPFDGVIAEQVLEAGSFVSPQTPVFRLIADAVELRVTVDEGRIGMVTEGLATEVAAPAYADRVFDARVASVNRTGDPNAHTFEVRILADDPEGLLRPGMSAEVTIVAVDRPDAVLVPVNAVLDTADGPAVFTVEDGHARLQHITTGISDPTSVEVLDGLHAGDQIVVVGQQLVRDGDEVRVTP
ncbi:MAG: efflux RND transporter periplasmic adaptor subunit [Dehalococcoidia bacterium]